MKIMIQWKVNRWCNYTDKNEKVIYFKSIEEAEQYLADHHWYNLYRIVERIGSRKFREIKQIDYR